MRIELLPGTDNVIRFPAELRHPASLDTLRQLAPDYRHILSLTDAFGLETPSDNLRDHTDAETAGFIAQQAPPRGQARANMLKMMQDHAIERALDSCRRAESARRSAHAAGQTLAQAEPGSNPSQLDGLRQQAAVTAELAAILLLQAHERCEEAEGVARAVTFDREDRSWFPRNHHDETDALIAIGATGGR